eukprot:CAMPEP_0183358148 /NCGR_PEP_ID=MMETSP0164_2-20130417/48352_1 /TAXON_ID=221442 /ORGANISM="Coccolithus pelagicus ssp braarudi, Strain PLY182g" /LENGTH=149 /DNA_ID=CAMNT_0025531977 /DNA_START=246 /DNA_END=695 /DNA_ORIENTATION=+
MEPLGHCSWVEEHDADSKESDGAAKHIAPVRCGLVDKPAPSEAHPDEDATVDRVQPPKVVEWLQAGDEPVQAKDTSAAQSPPPRCSCAHRLPYEPAAADLSKPSGEEERADARDRRHAPILGHQRHRLSPPLSLCCLSRSIAQAKNRGA